MIDAQEQQLNLEYLNGVYFEQSNAKEAAKLLRQMRAGQAPLELQRLLRDHRQAPVSEAETYQRDAFDFLLAYYGILEIACLIRYIHDALPHEIASTALENLSDPAVRRYYEDFYPILLPSLFRMRLQGQWTTREALGEVATSSHELFNEFLGLVNLQRSDEAMDIFLWFLDDGSTDGYTIEDTLEQLHNPSKLLKRFVKPPHDCDALDRSLRGLQNFVSFCLDLDDLLQRSARYPLLQSAQWHYYAYWFTCIQEKVAHTIDKVIEQVKHWSPRRKPAKKAKEIKGQVDNYVSQVRDVLQRILSGQYGQALGERMREPRPVVQVDLSFESPASRTVRLSDREKPALVLPSRLGPAPKEFALTGHDKPLQIRPLSDRVVVHCLAANEKTAGGLVLPDTAKRQPQKGEVLAVGEGYLQNDGSRLSLQIQKGDMVIFAAGAGEEVKKSIVILREGDILAIVK